MHEIENILIKYSDEYFHENLQDLSKLNFFAATFFKDVAELYDCITRVKNSTRNPTGYSFNDAPIIGLLVKIWKLLKEIVVYYEKDNAEIISLLERPLIESAITASYLMQSDENVIVDYRKISYKDRLRILREMKSGSSFFNTKAGKRLLKSVEEKMALEGFDENSFSEQKQNKWKLQGKSFFDIFKIISHEELYSPTFGVMSESIHASWNDSMDWCLQGNEDGTFDVFPFYHPADIRYVSPTLIFCNNPYKLWLERIDVHDPYLYEVLDWIQRVNTRIFMAFDNLYEE